MLLTRWTPHRALSRNHRYASPLDRMFEDFWGTGPSDLSTPATDVVETENEYRLSMELPGLKKDDLTITVKDNVLELSAEKKREDETKDAHFHRRERSFGRVERRFSFADAIQADKIEASYRDGVLEILVPKAEEAKPKTVEVKIH